jgi:hypothetical protein
MNSTTLGCLEATNEPLNDLFSVLRKYRVAMDDLTYLSLLDRADVLVMCEQKETEMRARRSYEADPRLVVLK